MSGFLYFIPTAPAADGAKLAELGLDKLLGPHTAQGHIDIGPDGGAGGTLVWAAGPSAPPARYDAESQRWYPHTPPGAAACDYWLGFVTDARPGAEDLARDRQIPGRQIVLGDGSAWEAPTARLADLDMAPTTALPCRYSLDDAGRTLTAVVADHETLWAMASETWLTLVGAVAADSGLADGEMESTMTNERARQIAAAALGANYRLGPLEADALELLTTDNVQEILQTLVDFQAFIELCDAEAKKKASTPASSAGGCGPPA